MKTIFAGIAAATIALSATGALAENAASEQRAKLEALWDKTPSAERQVSSANRPSVLDILPDNTAKNGDSRFGQTEQSARYFPGAFASGPINR